MKKKDWILVDNSMMASCNETRHTLLNEVVDIVLLYLVITRILISRVDTTLLSCLSLLQIIEYDLLN